MVTGITNDSGSSGSDGITNDQTLVISGTAEANSTVSVSVDGGLPVDVTANGGGVWSYDYTATTLSEGAHTVTATATDAAGNTSATSATFNLTVDLTAPAAPVVTGITNDSGSSGSDGITNDQTLVISGTAEANSTVSVSVDGGLPVDVTANGGGVWSYDYTATTLSEGAHTVTATATDAAGNTSATSATFNLTVDLTAPAAPVVTGITNDSGSSGSDGITNDQTLVISGTAEANSTVSVSVDGGLPVDVTANGGGVWSYDYTATTLSEGAHTVTATATDAAGNTSATSATFNLTVDLTAPAAPVVTGITNDNLILADRFTYDDTLLLSGNAEAGSSVQISVGGNAIGSPVVATGGNWTFDYTGTSLADGVYTFTATATDSAGNTSVVSATFVVTESSPTITSVTPDTGVSSSDFLTGNNGNVSLRGTAAALGQVSIFQDGVSVGSVFAGTDQGNGVGNWIFNVTLADGTYGFAAKDINTGKTGSSVSVTIDATAITATPDLTAASDTGTSATDNITKNTNPSFTVAIDGSTKVGDVLELLLDGVSLAHPVTHTITGSDLGGSVTLAVTNGDLGVDGTKSFTTKLTDNAGNTGTSAALVVTLDTAVGALSPDLLSGSDSGTSTTDNLTKTTNPTFRVSLDQSGTNTSVGDTLELLLGGASFTTPVTKTLTLGDLANMYVDLTVVDGELGGDGVKLISSKLSDPAGNSVTSAALTITLDTTVPSITSGVTTSVQENSTTVIGFVSASDLHTLAYSLSGGADIARFTLNPTTGALAFATPPDSETPTDTNLDNAYLVQFTVTDSAGNATTQNISVSVTDLNDCHPGSHGRSKRVD